MEATLHASSTVTRLMPSRPPASASRTSARLFWGLHALANEDFPDTPDAVGSMLQRWAACEEQCKAAARSTRNWEKLADSAVAAGMPADTPLRGWDAWSPRSPLEILRHTLSRSLSGSFGTTEDDMLGAAQHSLTEPALPALSPLASRPPPGTVPAAGSPASHAARLPPSIAPAPAPGPAASSAAPLNTGSAGPDAPGTPRGAQQANLAIEQLRWALAARACLGLLDWWLLSLLDLAFKVSRSREWWARQARRPLRHLLWRGPRHWLSEAPLPHEAPLPSVALARLHMLQSRHASQVGALRHTLSEFNHAPSIDAIKEVTVRALTTLEGIADEHALPEMPARPPSLSTRPPPLSTPGDGGIGGWTSGDAHIAAIPAAPEDAPVGGTVGIGAPSHEKPVDPVDAEVRSVALLSALRAVARRSGFAREAAQRKLQAAAYPSHLQRHWLSYTCAAAAAATLALYVSRRSEAVLPLLRRSAREASSAVVGFLKEHVYSPAAIVVKELYKPQYQRVSDPREISEADALLRSLLRQFKMNWSSELNALVAAGGGGAAAAGAVAASGLPPVAAPEHEDDIDDGLVNYGGAKVPRTHSGSHHGGSGGDAERPAHAAGSVRAGATGSSESGGARAHDEPASQAGKEGGRLLGSLTSAVGGAVGAVGDAVGEATKLRRWTSSGAWKPHSNPITDGLPPEQAEAAELEAMSRLFVQQMQSPAYNMARGPLLQLLLIQTQYMRRELLLQMGAMDTLMAQNYLTATISAMLPGAMALTVLVAALRRLARRLRSRRRSRASLLKQVRSVLRDAERLLLRSLAGRCERLSQVDLGLLVISLHAMRQTVLRHRVLLSVGERHQLWEDCADLESDNYDVSQKLLILQRMYRTQPALLAAGPPGRTRHDELGSGMQTVGESLARGSSRNLAGCAPSRNYGYGRESPPAAGAAGVGVVGGGGDGGAGGGRSRSERSVRFAPSQGPWP